MSATEVLKEIEKDKVFYRTSIGGVTVSGGEPLRQSAFLTEFLQACKAHDVHTIVETSGYAAWSNFKRILPNVDLILYDIKIADPDEHKKRTGVSNLTIIKNLGRLLDSGKEVQVRTPLIPGITTSRVNLTAIAQLLRELGISEIELLPYNELAGDKYGKLGRRYGLQDIEYSEEFKQEAESVFRNFSINSR